MSQHLPKDIPETADLEREEDPLAQLARIISAGSVFGLMPDAAPKDREEAVLAPVMPFAARQAEKPSADEEMPLGEDGKAGTLPREAQSDVEAVALSSGSSGLFDDLDNALGAQLEAELISELRGEPETGPSRPFAGTGMDISDTAPEMQFETEAGTGLKIDALPQFEASPAIREETLFEEDRAGENAGRQPDSEHADTGSILENTQADRKGLSGGEDDAPIVAAHAGSEPEPMPPSMPAVEPVFEISPTEPETVPAQEEIAPETVMTAPMQEKAPRPTSSAAIEEALNLDSFFDAEFAAATGRLAALASASRETADSQGKQAFGPTGFVSWVPSAAPETDRPVSALASPEPSGIPDADGAMSPASKGIRQTRFVSGDADPLDTIEFDTQDDDFSFTQAAGQGTSRGTILALAVALVLIVTVIGAGAYFISGIQSGGDGDIVIAADPTPVRVKPDDPGGIAIPNQDRTVYETISGAGSDPVETSESGLVDRSETPIVNLEPEAAEPAPRVILPGPANNETISATVPPRGPRKVRTVVIRPDGTVVGSQGETGGTAGADGAQTASAPETSSPRTITIGSPDGEHFTPRVVNTEKVVAALPQEDAIAGIVDRAADGGPAQNIEGGEIHPEAADALDRLPSEEIVEASAALPSEAASPVSSGVSLPGGSASASGLPPLPRANASRPVSPASSSASRGIATASAAPIDLRPSVRPADEEAAVSTAASVPVAAAGAPAPSSGSGFVVQLSSQRSPDEARETFKSLQRRYAVLSGYQPVIQRADLGDRGIYHRLRVGPFERGEAIRLCETLKSAGGDCIVSTN